jgi:hypothetical protein
MMTRIAGLRDNRAIEYSSNDQWRSGRERPVVDHLCLRVVEQQGTLQRNSCSGDSSDPATVSKICCQIARPTPAMEAVVRCRILGRIPVDSPASDIRS